MKETNIENKTKKIEGENKQNYLKVLGAEVLEDNVYRYTMISNVPFMINEILYL